MVNDKNSHSSQQLQVYYIRCKKKSINISSRHLELNNKYWKTVEPQPISSPEVIQCSILLNGFMNYFKLSQIRLLVCNVNSSLFILIPK